MPSAHTLADTGRQLADVLANLFSAPERAVLVQRLGVRLEEISLRVATADEEAWAMVRWFVDRDRSADLVAAVHQERPRALPLGFAVPARSSSTNAAAAPPAAPSLRPASDATAAAVNYRTADVLIITALKEEYDEARKVDDGAVNDWTVDRDLTGFEVALRTYRGEGGGLLRVALTWATKMRTTATADAAGRLIDRLGVRCLAMSGVCAGRRGKVHPGDVIIGSLLYTYDTGAIRTEYDERGQAHSHFQAAPNPIPLDEQWLHRAQAFTATATAGFQDAPWLAARPPTLEAQGHWILAQLHASMDPAKNSDRAHRVPAWKAAIERLRKLELVTAKAPLALTADGTAHIDDLLLLHDDGLPEPPRWQVHVAPIATGNNVMRDQQLFDRLSDSMREVLGVEMEAAAIATIAHARRLHWIVMKGVMDHGDHDKEDGLKPFAARASAECLLRFVREIAELRRLLPSSLPSPPHPAIPDVIQRAQAVLGDHLGEVKQQFRASDHGCVAASMGEVLRAVERRLGYLDTLDRSQPPVVDLRHQFEVEQQRAFLLGAVRRWYQLAGHASPPDLG